MHEGRHSGEAMTSAGNSANNIHITETAYTFAKIEKYNRLALILGDDNLTILEVPETFDTERLK